MWRDSFVIKAVKNEMALHNTAPRPAQLLSGGGDVGQMAKNKASGPLPGKRQGAEVRHLSAASFPTSGSVVTFYALLGTLLNNMLHQTQGGKWFIG